jgi:Lrp/AsnC family transcriptional regulator, regulator of ectoine-degradation genes
MQKGRKRKTGTDRLDLRILAALSEHGRQTLTDLSKAVGLSPTPCAARVESLEADQLILGYHADVDIERLADLSLYFVTVTAKPYSVEVARKLEAIMFASPYIVSADALFGSIDYLIRVYARSTTHYHEIMSPLVELGVDYETWPVSRKVMAPKMHGLVAHVAKPNG